MFPFMKMCGRCVRELPLGEVKVADVASLAGALRRTLVLREIAKCDLV